ncbi:MAG TPA: carotenoid biosynthesis protein [Candidatus Paceibacterota bacterium]|nr:carotenoid biosynthesis protein [Candidatus Paceibacterota bacterium]
MAQDSKPMNVTEASGSIAGWLHGALLGLFLAASGLAWAKLVVHNPALVESNWPEILLLITAVAATLRSVSRTLPFQNVTWGAMIIGVIGGMAHTVGSLTLIPFGPYVFTAAAGPRILGVLPWIIPPVWIVFIYASRGVARLILQRWRWTRFYGFWLIGLTALLSMALDFSFDPLASGMKHLWIWELTRFPYAWRGTPLTNFAGWLATSAVAAAFVTPMLINKKPDGKTPKELGTLLIWATLLALFLAATLTHGS